MDKIKITSSSIKELFIVILLLELFIGGGGRIFSFGGITLRMILFLISILSCFFFFFGKFVLKKNVIYILVSFTAFSIFYILIGLINHAKLVLIFEDFKPLSFIYILLPLSLLISKDTLSTVDKLLRFSSLFMATAYLTILLLITYKVIPFLEFYQDVEDYNEFFFRGINGAFTYKGFIYMCIGLFFWTNSNLKFSKIILPVIIILIAIFFTGTRGFVLFIGIIYLVFWIFPKILRGKVYYLVFAITAVVSVIVYLNSYSTDLRAKISNSTRTVQVVQVINDITVPSIIFGHGFGIGVPSRKVHMEIAYLEIFHKQGLMGIFIWGVLFWYIYKLYCQARVKNKLLAQRYFMSVIFVALISFTNPYINNPIGLSMLVLCIVVYNKILDK
jgi:hypothetical protein